MWPTMRELASRVVCDAQDKASDETLTHLPALVWEDIASILKRVLLSEAPTLRKLGLYRLLRGDAGIDVVETCEDAPNQNDDDKVFMNKPKSNRIGLKKPSPRRSVLPKELTYERRFLPNLTYPPPFLLSMSCQISSTLPHSLSIVLVRSRCIKMINQFKIG